MRRASDRGATVAATHRTSGRLGARWLGLIAGLGLILGGQGVAFAGGPDPSTIAIDPPTPLKMGENPSGTIVAHLTQVGGQPVSAARLELFIDGTSASSNLTNGDGAAPLNFHRELLPGDHEIEVRFNGSRVATASNAFSRLTVLPVDDSRLTIGPLPRLQLGQDPTVTLVAHLVSNTGDPVSGARLDLLVDGVVTGGGITDPGGTAQITFRRVLTVGDHRVDLKFAGSRIAAPTSTSATLS